MKVAGIHDEAAPASDLEIVIAFVEEFGVPVFPCRPNDKRPATANGFKDATREVAQIRRWASEYRTCNWGMPTGAVSGIVAIDIDNRPAQDKHGDETLAKLVRQHGPLPDTATVLTPSGGQHLWFRVPHGLSLSSGTEKLGDGLDVKAEGGYVLIPPSQINGRPYEFEASSDPGDIGIAELPDWLARLLVKKPEEPAPRDFHSGARAVDWIASIADGNALHDSSRDLAAHYAAKGLGFEEICRLIEALMHGSKAPRDERWRERLADIPALVNSAIEKYRVARFPVVQWPEPLDLRLLGDHEPQAPRFIIPEWWPCAYATLCAGHGGVGKSGIALHLAVCTAAGAPFFGLEVSRRRVMYLSCEDRVGVLHWRFARICRFLGISLASLRGWLEVFDLVGQDSVLWERDPRTGHVITGAYGCLSERIKQHGTQVLFVDGISDTFGGNENAKTEVKRYVNALVALVPPDDGGIVLIGHVAKSAANAITTTEGYSGTTGWHNAVRARWYLYPETRPGEDGDRPRRTGDLILELQKSNLGRCEQQMRLSWDEEAHLFVGREIVGATAADRLAREQVERTAILRALVACAKADPPIIVPAAMQGPRTAFHVLAQRPEIPDSLRSGRPATRRFWAHIEALRQIRAIDDLSYRRDNRHTASQLVPTTEGVRQCVA